MIASTSSGTTAPGPVRGLWRDAIVRSAGFLILAQGAVAVAGFVFWVASAHLADADAVGSATTLVSASSLISYLSTFGVNAMFMRFLPTSEQPDAELTSGVIVCFVGGLLLAFGYVELLPVVAPKLVFVQHSPLYTAGFVVFTAFGAVNILTSSVFLVRRRAKYIFVTDGVIQGIVKILAPFVLIATGVYASYGAFGIFSSFGCAVLVDVLVSITLIVARLDYRPELRIRLSALTRTLRFTVINYLVTVLDILPTLILPTVVLDGNGSRSAGYFYIAFQVATVLSGVGVSVAVSTLAEGAQGNARLDEVVRRSRRILAVALPPIVVTGSAISPWALSVFGVSYREHASSTLLVLVLAVPAVALCQWTRSLLQITKQLPALLVSQLLYAVVVLGLSIAVVHRGIVWVAGAYLLGNLVAGLVAGGAFLMRRGKPRATPDATLSGARVCIFHNVVAPYRLPLFNRLAEDQEVVVLFGLERSADRMWATSLDGAGFAYRVLPAWVVGPLVLNPGLAAELVRRRPDVVIHADSDESLASLLVILALRRVLGYRVVLWVEHVPRTKAALRTTRAQRHRFQWPLTLVALWSMTAIRRMAYRRACALLSMSGAASDRFIAGLGTSRPIFTGTQVVPLSVLLPAGPRRDGRDPDRPVRILFLGYLRANKNVDSLIRAFTRTASGHEELVIAGAGPELKDLEALAADRADVTFAGYVEGENKVALIRGADLLVVPSFIEPWGLVVNEALFYGVPVLASCQVASSALIDDGRTGLLFDPARKGELETRLHQYFADPALRARLRAGAAVVDVEVVAGVDRGVEHFQRALAAVTAGKRRS
jgi:glycosyltransferase involved in cell wall biosynthesis